jgi:hypothetical protein
MKQSLSIENIINKITELSAKLNQATLTQEELEDFQNLTTALNERVIILNYKAKEAKVFGEPEPDLENIVIEIPIVKEEPIVEQAPTSPSPINEEELSGILFDFSAPDKPEVNTSKEEDLTEINLSEQDDENEISEDVTSEKEEDVKEPIESKKSEIITPEVVTEIQPKEESITATRITEIKTDSAVYSFYERFSKVTDDSVMGMLGAQKIDSLSGAFGLNDRMQFINELFEGDSEKFSTTIEVLDNQETKEAAKIKLSEIAAQHQWEPDNILVEDLVKLVQRRYAD